MSFADDVNALIAALIKARGMKQLPVSVGDIVLGALEILTEDEAVIRETQWEVLQETDQQISWDETRMVLEGFIRVLKGGVDAETDRAETSSSGRP